MPTKRTQRVGGREITEMSTSILPQLSKANKRNKTNTTAPKSPGRSNSLVPLVGSRTYQADDDLEEYLTRDGLFKATKAQVYNHTQRQLRPVAMTKLSSYARFKGVILDVDDISKIPPKMNLHDLDRWEKACREASNGLSAPNLSTAQRDTNSSKQVQPTASQPDEGGRTYAELLDEYSMHEFIIRKGVTLRNTPEFASFKRRNTPGWGNIELVIRKLEQFLKDYAIELAFVDGKKVAAIAAFQVDDILSREDMLQCIVNRDDVERLTNNVRQLYSTGHAGVRLAAQKIQATWRMFAQRIAYKHLIVGMRAATVIQRGWKLYMLHCITRKTIKATHDAQLLRWRKTMEEFRQRWPQIQSGRRCIIHLPSLSYPCFHAKNVPFYLPLQSGQFTRLADLRDPNVDVIILAPFRPEPEVLDYYYNVLETSGVYNPRGRLTLLVPEDVKRLPEGLSLTRLVLLSSRLMKCLGSIGRDKNTYIVPGVIGLEELSLAIKLNVPLLSSEPEVAQAFGTKSGSRRLLNMANVPMPVGVQGLTNREELLVALSRLIEEHREVSRWLVKLDTESGSRGHAYFDVSRLRAVNERNECTRMDWDAFMTMFDAVGGCVEAVPNRIKASLTANLFVDPLGKVYINSVVEPLLAPAFTVMGCHFPPQNLVPFSTIRSAALSIGKVASRKGIMGYLSVDFVVHDTCESGSPSLSAVDVDLFLTNNAAAHSFACLATNSTWSGETGTCKFNKTNSDLVYVYSGIIHSPFISAVRHRSFFSLCQAKGLLFDRQLRQGLVYHMVDVLLRGCIGVLSVGTQNSSTIKMLKDFQSLLNLELPKQCEHSSDSNFVYFYSVIHQLTRSLVASNS
uniref:IQCH-like ATP-grasp domain-containing protein n=1 Tax=Trypanosoma vivax (strain Y486) TaxID=1055687 RepID=G0TTP0_TRYVY|nr:conserved hypothetical protein, fragment [Trypanosoma vivax Y486]